MILISYPNGISRQCKEWDMAGLEAEHEAGSLIFRFEPSFYKYQRYAGGGMWEDLSWDRVLGE